MQLTYDGKIYRAIKITGPTHNLLGLALQTKSTNKEIKTEDLNTDEKKTINSVDIITQAMSGLSNFNNKYGTSYYIEKIIFVSSDSASKTVYEEMTIEILYRSHTGGRFKRN